MRLRECVGEGSVLRVRPAGEWGWGVAGRNRKRGGECPVFFFFVRSPTLSLPLIKNEETCAPPQTKGKRLQAHH